MILNEAPEDKCGSWLVTKATAALAQW